MTPKHLFTTLIFCFITFNNFSCQAHEDSNTRLYSINFYQNLKSCSPYSEKKFDGNEIKILGQNEENCLVLKISKENTQACVFKPEEISKLVEAGFSTAQPKRHFWEKGKNIFNNSQEKTYWNFYKYKCKEIQLE